MKASVKWLKEWVDFPCPDKALEEVFTHLGIEVVSQETCGGDLYYNLDIRPNRPDLLSIMGLAREISAYFSIPLKEKTFGIESLEAPSMDVVIEDKEDCPRYTVRCIDGIKVEKSPDWIGERLECSGISSINQIVDISNWVMLETGQPLHIFDKDKIEGKIIVRKAKDGERIITLDGQKRKLTPEILVIADEKKILAIAGVMGGIHSSVTASTKNIAIESAYFDPVRITRGVRSLSLETESAARFERKGDIGILPYSQDDAAYLVQEWASGKIEEKIFDSNPDVNAEKLVEITKERGEKLLGISLNMGDVVKKVERFGIKNVGNNPVKFLVPSFRRDIDGESDIWEEFARLTGYKNIPYRFRIKGQEMPEDPRYEFRRLREIAVFSGFYEVYNLSFMERSVVENLSEGNENLKNFVQLKNPMWPERDVMRTTLLLGLIESGVKNANRGIADIRLFEMGTVFFSPNVEKTYLSGILMGSIPREWHRKERKYDFYDIKGGVETILGNYDINFAFEYDENPLFEKHLCVGIYTEKEKIGWAGRVNRLIREKFGAPDAYAFEIDAGLLIKFKPTRDYISLPPKFPGIKRDVSLILNKDRNSEFVLNLIRDMNISILEDVRLMDYYTGKNIPEGKKSFAYSLVFRTKERTLNDEEVDKEMDKIFTILEKNNIEIRRQ